MTAGLAQILAQALTAWTIVMAFFDVESLSIWMLAPLFAALLVPFRHDGSLHDRAVSNFAASIAVAGIFGWELLTGLLDGLLGAGRLLQAASTMMMLTAAVLFAVAGGLFWTLQQSEAN